MATRKGECYHHGWGTVATRNLIAIVWPYLFTYSSGRWLASSRSPVLRLYLQLCLVTTDYSVSVLQSKKKEGERERGGKEGGHSGCPRWPTLVKSPWRLWSTAREDIGPEPVKTLVQSPWRHWSRAREDIGPEPVKTLVQTPVKTLFPEPVKTMVQSPWRHWSRAREDIGPEPVKTMVQSPWRHWSSAREDIGPELVKTLVLSPWRHWSRAREDIGPEPVKTLVQT